MTCLEWLLYAKIRFRPATLSRAYLCVIARLSCYCVFEYLILDIVHDFVCFMCTFTGACGVINDDDDIRDIHIEV